MSKNQLIVLAAAISILLVLIAVAVQMGGRRKVEANRSKAQELREEGDRSRLWADEQAANAASAEARARQARVEAAKLEREATERAQEAEESRGLALDHHRRAIELDPDTDGELDGQRPKQSTPTDDQRH